MKSCLVQFLVLTKPASRERLSVYLLTFKIVVSTVLVQQEGAEQHLIYYVNYLFKGLKLHYTYFEKLTLGLTLMAR